MSLTGRKAETQKSPFYYEPVSKIPHGVPREVHYEPVEDTPQFADGRFIMNRGTMLRPYNGMDILFCKLLYVQIPLVIKEIG